MNAYERVYELTLQKNIKAAIELATEYDVYFSEDYFTDDEGNEFVKFHCFPN